MTNKWAKAIVVVCGLCVGQAMAQELAFSSSAEANKAAAASAIVAAQQRLPVQSAPLEYRPLRPFADCVRDKGWHTGLGRAGSHSVDQSAKSSR